MSQKSTPSTEAAETSDWCDTVSITSGVVYALATFERVEL